MNISYPPINIIDVPIAIQQLGHEFIRALVFLLIPTELLYFSIYFRRKGHYQIYLSLSFLSTIAFWISPVVAPISCGPAKCLQNFASRLAQTLRILAYAKFKFPVAIGTMKLLDIWARGHSLPTYTAGKTPPDWLFALIVLTE